MKIDLTEEQIAEIAEQLDCGMQCFLNKKTGEIKTLPDFDRWIGDGEELMQREIQEIENEKQNLYAIEPPETHKDFEIMEDFADSVEDIDLRKKLNNALYRSKPFAHFKNILSNAEDYRQKWFDFKSARYIEHVKFMIEANEVFDEDKDTTDWE